MWFHEPLMPEMGIEAGELGDFGTMGPQIRWFTILLIVTLWFIYFLKTTRVRESFSFYHALVIQHFLWASQHNRIIFPSPLNIHPGRARYRSHHTGYSETSSSFREYPVSLWFNEGPFLLHVGHVWEFHLVRTEAPLQSFVCQVRSRALSTSQLGMHW